MTDSLKIVTTRLFVANVRVEGSVSSGTSQILSLPKWNVLIFGILVAFGQTEIDDVDIVLGGLGGPDQKVVWFDISMDNALLVHLLNTLNLIKAKC